MLMLNAMFTIFFDVMEEEAQVLGHGFADDANAEVEADDNIEEGITGKNQVAIKVQGAIHLLGEFATITKQQVPIGKTYLWGNTKELRELLKQIRYQGAPLTVKAQARVLGAFINYGIGHRLGTQNDRTIPEFYLVEVFSRG